jgi:protein tyrosine phosphatase (PTP) superfamily phosphohydrolase (DUF442 family)
MIRRVLLAVLASGLVIGAVGCRHRCCTPTGVVPRPFHPPAPGGPVLGPPTGSATIPPAGLPTTPAGPVVPGVGPSAVPAVPAPAPGLPPPAIDIPREGNFGPSPTPPPANGGREILLPEPLPGGSSRSGYPAPSGVAPAGGVLGGPVRAAQGSEPPVAGRAAAAGLSGFAPVKDGVASGRKPTLDGFDALKRGGYRTVVYLHPAGADTSATRDLAEKKGLAFVAIETTPEKLADALAEFNKVLADAAARPVYVADDDGVRAGALWYLHFRTGDLIDPDAARIRARALGLTDQTEDAKTFWAAINQFLATR